ncbi:hypothetical protein DPEC_G00362970 [Dallia pectoralis]|nr:hypothetical protein DPEC_G00362970 [Dallia pectoralis]
MLFEVVHGAVVGSVPWASEEPAPVELVQQVVIFKWIKDLFETCLMVLHALAVLARVKSLQNKRVAHVRASRLALKRRPAARTINGVTLRQLTNSVI